MTFLRRRTAHRSCRVHGDNGCELQGEAGPRSRVQDKREWRTDLEREFEHAAEVYADEIAYWSQPRSYVSASWAGDWSINDDEAADDV